MWYNPSIINVAPLNAEIIAQEDRRKKTLEARAIL